MKTRKNRSSDLSKQKILSAALDEFTAKGFDGGRVDRIVANSGVSKNLLYYYFGSKDKLFLTLLENAYAAMRRDQTDETMDDAPPLQVMERFVCNTFRHFVKHPEIVTLLASANLHLGRHLDGSEVIQDLFDPLVNSIEKTLSRGKKEGVFRQNVDVIDLYISIAGLGFFYQSCRFTLGKLFNRDLEDPVMIKKREKHIVDMIMRYLQA